MVGDIIIEPLRDGQTAAFSRTRFFGQMAQIRAEAHMRLLPGQICKRFPETDGALQRGIRRNEEGLMRKPQQADVRLLCAGRRDGQMHHIGFARHKGFVCHAHGGAQPDAPGGLALLAHFPDKRGAQIVLCGESARPRAQFRLHFQRRPLEIEKILLFAQHIQIVRRAFRIQRVQLFRRKIRNQPLHFGKRLIAREGVLHGQAGKALPLQKQAPAQGRRAISLDARVNQADGMGKIACLLGLHNVLRQINGQQCDIRHGQISFRGNTPTVTVRRNRRSLPE